MNKLAQLDSDRDYDISTSCPGGHGGDDEDGCVGIDRERGV